LPMNVVSYFNLSSPFAEIGFIESSALNSSNVETAFSVLITQIYNKLNKEFYDDRLEQFNFFGSEKMRQRHLEIQTAQQSQNDSVIEGTPGQKKDRRKTASRRGPDG